MELRLYQRLAVEAALESRGRFLIVSPTGSGKTVIGVECARPFETVVWCVHTRELVAQAFEKLSAAFPGDVAVIMPGWSANPFCKIQVASTDTLVSRGYRPPAELLILDEAHHYLADEYRQIAATYKRVIGLTATPERSDGRPLGDIFDAFTVAAQYPALVAEGHLVPARVFRPDECLSSDLASHPVKAYLRHGENKSGFVFCKDVDHAEKLSAEFCEAGVSCEVIEAETPGDLRRSRIERFRAGELRLLANVYCLTEGIDVPEAAVCMLCRGVTHVSPYLQMVGRVLRPARGKSTAILLDLPGVTYKHGLPTEVREYSLQGRGIKRSKSTLVVCIQCGMTCTGLPCPRCKFKGNEKASAPPKIYDMALREVYAGPATPENAKTAELSRLLEVAERRGLAVGFVVAEYKRLFGEAPAGLHYADEDTRKNEFVRLRRVQNEKGYKDGWVSHRFKATFGSFPPRGWFTPPRDSEGRDQAQFGQQAGSAGAE